MNSEERIESLESSIVSQLEELRSIKDELGLHKGYKVCPGGILNAYRDGDISFNDAVDRLSTIRFEDLNILYKFLHNRVDAEKAIGYMQRAYPHADAGYIKEKAESLVTNPFRFMISRGEKEILGFIYEDIKKTEYKG